MSIDLSCVCLVLGAGLVHVGDELREVNGISIIHKRPDEISQLLVRRLGSRDTSTQPYSMALVT